MRELLFSTRKQLSSFEPNPGGSFPPAVRGRFERLELFMSKKLSQRKAAAHLDIPVSTFAGYIRTGRGPRHIDLHGIRYFDVDDLDAWLAARTVEGAQ
jgi:hypothetical protein